MVFLLIIKWTVFKLYDYIIKHNFKFVKSMLDILIAYFKYLHIINDCGVV